MLMSGAQAVVASLKAEGVDLVFGYPGGAALHLYDALYDSGITHILTRHEQGAAHAADGYARATGMVISIWQLSIVDCSLGKIISVMRYHTNPSQI